ncbi:hypothetical protein FRB99_004409 [Tulasnella sp. 403]|nr:hypothetical protein FRB99_004409 [Tulasnella sp. 403]
MDSPSYIKSLNQAQLRAVTHDPSIPLQILAGPGSGKTRVLTSRVAYLVDHHKISPSRICAVTFTNKAANEMRHRLRPLIGENATNSLVMGTFHAICSKYLRKNATKISLKHNFSICDSDERSAPLLSLAHRHLFDQGLRSKRVVSKIFKTKAKDLKAKSIEFTDSSVVSCISNAKAKTLSPSDLSVEAEQNDDDAKRIISEIYEEYEATLKSNNSLDFDDLLVYGVQLFTKCPDILKSCEHILVDEL